MKRASTKSVKVHPACTSAVMIGLAISLGASSLLLTRQSAYGALVADAVGNALTFNTQAAATVRAPSSTNNSSVALAKLPQVIAATEPQSNLYIQNLQTEIQRSWQKYPVQQTGSKIPSEPFNSQVHLAQAAELLQPAIQKRFPTQISSPVPARAKQAMATVSTNLDPLASPQSLWGQHVSPELPPLAAVGTYLPKALAPFKGYIWPAKGVVTSPFGWRWGRMHRGIDVAGPVGTPVVAAAAGVVVTASLTSGGYGNLVDIQHPDGSMTRYAHNSRILVQVGQVVKQGEEIAQMGSTGFSTGPHCHFEVHPPGHGAVNPIAYLPR